MPPMHAAVRGKTVYGAKGSWVSSISDSETMLIKMMNQTSKQSR